MIFNRLIAWVVVSFVACQPALALTPAQRIVVLNGVQGWALPGSSADLFFSRNAGSCAINRLLVSCPLQISTTRAQTVSSYAQWADGHFSAFAANVARITDQGLLVEQASTNKALWSNDWTNAAYVKVNVTAAKDQTGPDNVANSASSITATANAATILQTITEVGATNTESVYLKRITGTGTITLVQNGVSGTACALSTTAWTLCSVTASQLNPALGIIMATNGDKIAVWEEQFEALAFPTSPIPTTTVAIARSADVITLTGAALTAALNAKAARFVTNLIPPFVSGGNNILVQWGTASQLASINFASSTTIATFNGTGSAIATLGSGSIVGLVKNAAGFDATSVTAVGNGGAKVTTAEAWPNVSGQTVNIGQNRGSNFLNGYMLRATFSPVKGIYDLTTTGSNPQ